MALTKAQLESVNRDIITMRAVVEKRKIGIQLAVDRVNALGDQYAIEEMFVFAQVIEHIIREVLNAFKTKKRVEMRLGLETAYHDLSDLREDLNLGRLIHCLAKEAANHPVLKDLSEFNKQYRNEFVHRIFDGEETNMDAINTRARTYLDAHGAILITALQDLEGEVERSTYEMLEKEGATFTSIENVRT